MEPNSHLSKINETPHAKALNLKLVSAAASTVVIQLPSSEAIIGDPVNRTIHGGAITTLLDTACGAAIFQTQNNFRAMATLDLRVDHMRPASADIAINAHADCYRLTHTIAFVRATLYTNDINQPIATAMGSFVRSNEEFPTQ